MSLTLICRQKVLYYRPSGPPRNCSFYSQADHCRWGPGWGRCRWERPHGRFRRCSAPWRALCCAPPSCSGWSGPAGRSCEARRGRASVWTSGDGPNESRLTAVKTGAEASHGPKNPPRRRRSSRPLTCFSTMRMTLMWKYSRDCWFSRWSWYPPASWDVPSRSGQYLWHLILPRSTSWVIMATTSDLLSQIICQKAVTVEGRGPWQEM